jgi:hypothetical protein
LQSGWTLGKELPKSVSAPVLGPDLGTNKHDPLLVKNINEAQITINYVSSTAFTKSGSCVSIVSKSFYDED